MCMCVLTESIYTVYICVCLCVLTVGLYESIYTVYMCVCLCVCVCLQWVYMSVHVCVCMCTYSGSAILLQAVSISLES